MTDRRTARILPFPTPSYAGPSPYAVDRESNAPLSVVLDAVCDGDRARLDPAVAFARLDPAVAFARRRLTVQRALQACRQAETQLSQSETQERQPC